MPGLGVGSFGLSSVGVGGVESSGGFVASTFGVFSGADAFSSLSTTSVFGVFARGFTTFFLMTGAGVGVAGAEVGFFFPKTRSQKPAFFGTGVAPGTGVALAIARRAGTGAGLAGADSVAAALAFAGSGWAEGEGAGCCATAMAVERAMAANGA